MQPLRAPNFSPPSPPSVRVRVYCASCVTNLWKFLAGVIRRTRQIPLQKKKNINMASLID